MQAGSNSAMVCWVQTAMTHCGWKPDEQFNPFDNSEVIPAGTRGVEYMNRVDVRRVNNLLHNRGANRLEKIIPEIASRYCPVLYRTREQIDSFPPEQREAVPPCRWNDATKKWTKLNDVEILLELKERYGPAPLQLEPISQENNKHTAILVLSFRKTRPKATVGQIKQLVFRAVREWSAHFIRTVEDSMTSSHVKKIAAAETSTNNQHSTCTIDLQWKDWTWRIKKATKKRKKKDQTKKPKAKPIAALWITASNPLYLQIMRACDDDRGQKAMKQSLQPFLDNQQQLQALELKTISLHFATNVEAASSNDEADSSEEDAEWKELQTFLPPEDLEEGKQAIALHHEQQNDCADNLVVMVKGDNNVQGHENKQTCSECSRGQQCRCLRVYNPKNLEDHLKMVLRNKVMQVPFVGAINCLGDENDSTIEFTFPVEQMQLLPEKCAQALRIIMKDNDHRLLTLCGRRIDLDTFKTLTNHQESDDYYHRDMLCVLVDDKNGGNRARKHLHPHPLFVDFREVTLRNYFFHEKRVYCFSERDSDLPEHIFECENKKPKGCEGYLCHSCALIYAKERGHTKKPKNARRWYRYLCYNCAHYGEITKFPTFASASGCASSAPAAGAH